MKGRIKMRDRFGRKEKMGKRDRFRGSKGIGRRWLAQPADTPDYHFWRAYQAYNPNMKERHRITLGTHVPGHRVRNRKLCLSAEGSSPSPLQADSGHNLLIWNRSTMILYTILNGLKSCVQWCKNRGHLSKMCGPCVQPCVSCGVGFIGHNLPIWNPNHMILYVILIVSSRRI